MINYLFKFIDNEVVCNKISANKNSIYYGEDAINILRLKDSIKFKKARIKKDRLILENSNTKIIIKDLDLFYEHKLYNCLFNNIKKINKAVKKNNKSINVTRGTQRGIATASVVVSILLSIAAGRLIDDTKIDETNISYEVKMEMLEQNNADNNFKEIDNSIDKDLIYLENTPKEVIKDIDKYYNELDNLPYDTYNMINELDQLDTPEINSVLLSYDTEIDVKKLNNVLDNYMDIINERAPRWGVSPALAQAMTTQETGGYFDNLMRISFSAWEGQEITLYNYDTGRMESIILTNNPKSYVRKPNTQYITEQDLMNPRTNISVGCILLQYSFERMNHNIPAAIQCYNFGTSNMNKVLDAAAFDNGMTREELLSEQNNLCWLEYRNIIEGEDGKYGDRHYLEHVVRYIPQDELDNIYINFINGDGEIEKVTITIKNSNLSK